MSNTTERLYAQRDHMAQGDYYVRHVSAMTAEGLHAKSAIAAELAHRDIEIARLSSELEEARRDAERYRWLRNGWAEGAAVDTAIDAAIAAQGAKG